MSAYTEEEAKTKWCPFSRVHQIDNVSSTAINRIADPSGKYDAQGNVPACTPGASLCIGSACMAWRFEPQMWRHTSAAGAGTWDEPKEVNGYGRKGQKLPHVGYCGLARKPK